ncbi:hypothetical protein B0H13DRAFT_2084928, partial [Mycena leptocephala]
MASVFGVEWIFDLAYPAHNAAVEAWKSCTICDDELWLGNLVSCSNDENLHWYCLKCFACTTTAMITGDVALSYDPRTTFPLFCYCLSSSSSILDTQSLSPQIRRSWNKTMIAIQLQGLGLPLITCSHCSYVVVDKREDSEHRPAPQTIPNTGSLRRRLAHTISSYIGCGAYFRPGLADDHKCRTDDLRLEIERVVDGGCNHCTCLCRAEYCHICHASLGCDQSSVWKTIFCDYFIEGDRD